METLTLILLLVFILFGGLGLFNFLRGRKRLKRNIQESDKDTPCSCFHKDKK